MTKKPRLLRAPEDIVDLVALQFIEVSASTDQFLENAHLELDHLSEQGEFSSEVHSERARSFLLDWMSDTLDSESFRLRRCLGARVRIDFQFSSKAEWTRSDLSSGEIFNDVKW